jgi:predicted transposase YdaD
MVYKFPNLSREAIEAMFGVSELKKTRVYQEAKAEGEQAIILKMLAQRVGAISPEIETEIRALSLAQLEALGENLLAFNNVAELTSWLQSNHL